jgi:hypothetical protein
MNKLIHLGRVSRETKTIAGAGTVADKSGLSKTLVCKNGVKAFSLHTPGTSC